MAELIVGANIERLLVDYLPPLLAARGFAVPVSTKARSSESVTLYRTGGPRVTLVSDRPQVTFDCRAALEGRASDLALMVRGLVYATDGEVLGGHQVYGVDELTGPSNMPDPNYAGARYRWTALIHIRSTVL